MSGMRGGLIPEFTLADIDRKIEAFKQKKIKDMFETLSHVGINCVNFAKKEKAMGTKLIPAPGGGFWDRSGNLRSSIGYAVIYDGKVGIEKFEQVKDGAEGVAAGKKLVGELAKEFNKGMVLVVTAGMEYAAAVESKGYDVITGSSFEGEKLLKFMKEKLGALL